MAPSFFTGLVGSLIHPVAMVVVIALWVTTWSLGITVRQKRLSPGDGEGIGLLSGIARENKTHHKLSAGLVFLTTFFCFVGMANTYLRSGRLFPGPHLYGGLAVLLAASINVALVPWFKDAVGLRTVHAAVGVSLIALLANQVWSGWPILTAVWKNAR